MDSIVRGLPEPFPHLIIESMYNEEELDLIWEELVFLSKPHKFLKEDLGTDRTEEGEPKSSSKSIHLDCVYTDRLTSNILTLNRKLFGREIMEKFAEISPMCRSILSQNNDSTKIRYYENGDEYLPHTDVFNYTAITFFFKKPKSFEGGELIFPEFDYTFECNDNNLILFPSCILHAANKVKMTNDTTCSGNGRYSMMQFLKIV
jgi:Rps23 Pro-64 3,4-dihydroxylase Tpa1-like proline 4-hydroxylase